MKKTSLYISALVLGAVAMQSCDDNWTRPPQVVPTFPEGIKANISIADLKTQYWQDAESYGTDIGLSATGDSLWIVGNVVSSDEAGNIYKTLVVEDETGAITIGINSSDLYKSFPRGVRVAINATGLCIGRYNGLMQMGTNTSSGVNRIELDVFEPHTYLDLNGGKMDTTVTTIAELNEAARTNEGKIKWQSRLIRINDVEFTEPGELFAPGSTTSRYITDADGNRMIVYNSSYADFAYEALPWGHGDVVGILSAYRNSWQLLLINQDGCVDFDGEGAPDPNLETILSAPFTTADDLCGFTLDNILLGEGLSYVWSVDAKYGLKASAFAGGSSKPSDSWAVSPVIDLTGHKGAKLNFSHCVNKFGSIDDVKTQATLGVRVDGGEWESVAIPQYSGNDNWDFVDSGEIDLAKYDGKKIHIGFHYVSTAASAGTWEIKNVKLTAVKNQ
ncbi:MAG: DUF5689 domain-containing protein [Bacteroidales bacterium]|nr:DUF5689 domain-containing protein [Bacteroidales bacterium]